MGSLTLTPDELKAIDSTRNRLFQLVKSISSLQHDVVNSHPLPLPTPYVPPIALGETEREEEERLS